MTGYVVDASIVVKWLVKEEWSDEASRLLETEATLIAPEGTVRGKSQGLSSPPTTGN